jgi:ubiquinone/menaquinone biosynthesis C-methylase UbiE
MKDYSLKSGERYHTLDLNLIGGDHLWRYRYAINRIKQTGKKLFGADIFCGSGYGAALAAQQLDSSVLAIDGSSESIAVATEKLLDPNIIWAAKLFPFDLPQECFDFVLSMESIEHVKDYESFFWVLARSLKRGGQLFISSPNEAVMPYTGYKWHWRHFLPAELRELAKQCGLHEEVAFSTTCQLLKDGKSCLFYPHQMRNDEPLPLQDGDTMFFEFRKL